MTNNNWQKFRKKETFEAFQVTKKLHDELIKKMIFKVDIYIIHNNVEFLLRFKSDRTCSLAMKYTPDDECEVCVNDWIIEKEDDGSYMVMSDIQFKNNYELVGSDNNE